MDLRPPYAVPCMTEIASIPWNGLTVASTFSGCGGSSLGYRMAGYRVLWANEFIPAARDTYRANSAAYTHLDDRDIRAVEPADVLDRVGLAVGDLDILDGSPPCASFSMVGKREASWGHVKKYSDTEQRTDDLFYEYARLVRGIQPRVFVAENVSGLVKGTAKGYFLRVLAELRACGYQVTAKLLDAQWLGVPQARQRLIFVGVRNDLRSAPVHPTPLPYRYTVRDALPHVVAQGDNGGFGFGSIRSTDGPSPTITTIATGGNKNFPPGLVIAKQLGLMRDPETGQDLSIDGLAPHALWNTAARRKGGVARKLSLAELRQVCGFPADFVLTGTYSQRWERLGRAVPPPMMAAIAATVRDSILRPGDEEAA